MGRLALAAGLLAGLAICGVSCKGQGSESDIQVSAALGSIPTGLAAAGTSESSLARVTKLDGSGQVAIIDIGTLNGVSMQDKYFTYRGTSVTGLLLPVRIFPQEAICVVGNPPPGKDTAKLHVGDLLTPNLGPAFRGSSKSGSGSQTMGPTGMPAEEGLKSLQASMNEVKMVAPVNISTAYESIAGTQASIEEQRKRVDEAWKQVVANVKNSKPMPNR